MGERLPKWPSGLLHGGEVLSETEPGTTLPYVDNEKNPDVPRERAPALTPTSCDEGTPTEPHSLRAVPAGMKTNGRKIKLNAILEDALTKTFLTEDVTR
ncbi:hypothetical protein AWC38_SpisGene25746, partial [Stylophora pistillata]